MTAPDLRRYLAEVRARADDEEEIRARMGTIEEHEAARDAMIDDVPRLLELAERLLDMIQAGLYLAEPAPSPDMKRLAGWARFVAARLSECAEIVGRR